MLAKLRALGVTCLINDPPRQAQDTAYAYVELTDLLARADIVSLHVPLEDGGSWPTRNLANAAFFDALKNDAIFINTARGAVVAEAALHAKLARCPEFSAVLDVWRHEPDIDPALLARADLGTPHIAGYSLDGKARGTAMLYHAICEYFGITPTWAGEQSLPPAPLYRLSFSNAAEDREIISRAVLAAYDLRRDDADLRRIQGEMDPAAHFDGLRKHYPVRREFSRIQIEVPASRHALRTRLKALGFGLST